jgi:hypothetical protein
MNPANTNTNGRARKSLASQIDRLDEMLDGLGENLNAAVAQAVKDAVSLAVREAVRGVLTEVLTNPDLPAKLRAAQDASEAGDDESAGGDETPRENPPAEPRAPGRLAACRDWVGSRLKQLGAWCRGCVTKVCATATAVARGVACAVALGLCWIRRKAARCRLLWHTAACAGAALAVGAALRLTGVIPSLSPSYWWGALAGRLSRSALWVRCLVATYVFRAATAPAYCPA